jgi:hypothetical protein
MMAIRAKFAVGAVAAAALATLVAPAIGRRAFQRKVAQEVAELFARSRDARPTMVTAADLLALPEPVQRWLRYAQVVGNERPITVRLKQDGLFRLAEEKDWIPFQAEEYYTTDPPGFIWVATMKMSPLVSVTGRDRYLDGRGNMHIRLLSLVPIADASGPEIDQGTLLRYLNETMWFPGAALSPYITWEAIDADSARATMGYRGVRASATFFFDEQGKLTNMIAQRYRTVGRNYSLDTWSTPITAYGELEGTRIPVAGEGVWKLSSGDFPYIKLRVTELEYNPAMDEG